ncbi:hypothetical protein PILCRDRAFT_3569 [Piloderma croceum F 1598]|uniref:Tc1-like transposase DDE domain-containing protein n=1 Tax=Piloderma croceum (strain F 1598) TaxID=765440 RepID=A0A0C3GB32_PILCF|nr:hypothetical protein PILCRDRAFT_3569 [Piloderma croceum F 1598]
MVNRRISSDIKETSLTPLRKDSDDQPSSTQHHTHHLQVQPRRAEIYLDELQYWLAIHHDIAISVAALHRNLEDTGLTHKILHKIATEQDEVLHAKWRNHLDEKLSGTGDKFVFADDSTTRCFGHTLARERAHFHNVFIQGGCYSFVTAMTKKEYIATKVVPASFDSFDFFDFIAEEVLLQMNPWPDNQSVLVIDNCHIYHNDALVDLVHDASLIPFVKLPSHVSSFVLTQSQPH